VAGKQQPGGPCSSISTPEATGVVAIIAPEASSSRLVSVIAPALVSGNTVVVRCQRARSSLGDQPERGARD
jgi:acyl-CoA reductase-like NAD-dependent aldehyde dehydrogenase